MSYYDLIGKRFGRLKVVDVGFSKKIINKDGKRTGTRKYWKCVCDCGNHVEVVTHSLIKGYTKSCGCYHTEKLKERLGEKHPNWKGGSTIRRGKEGNRKMVMSKKHPYCDRDGYVSEHRLVMEKHLGRYLKKNEQIHHKNGETMDNRIENLELWIVSHPSGQRISDKIQWCIEFLKEYAPDCLSKN